MADWSLLPKELLQLISEKLDSDFYILRFRSVCSTWRFSIPKPLNLFPLNVPHFYNSTVPIIHKLSKHNIFLIKPPSTPNQQTPHRPWLVRITLTSTGKFNLWHPLLFHPPIPFNLLDFNQLHVFDIGHIYVTGHLDPNSSRIVYPYYNRAVATFQGEQILDIATQDYSSQLVMFRCGDNGWTKIPNVENRYQDIVIFKGRPCVTYGTGLTLMIGSDFSVHLVAEPVFDGDDVDGDVNITVENESELLLVHKYIVDYDRHDDYDDNDDDVHRDDELVRFDVFRLDQKEKKWLKLTNLGDRILFLGQGYSFITSAFDLGFDNGNCLIYCNDDFDAWSEMSIFHLDQQRNSHLSDYPDYFKLLKSSPEWITDSYL